MLREGGLRMGAHGLSRRRFAGSTAALAVACVAGGLLGAGCSPSPSNLAGPTSTTGSPTSRRTSGPAASVTPNSAAHGTFSNTGSMTTPREDHTATLLLDGRVLIAGGADGEPGKCNYQPIASAELYDPATGTFSPTGSMTITRIRHTATLLSDGRVLITGGDGYGSAELYDPATGTFTPTGTMTANRSQHTATLLSDGRVLIAGGADWNVATVAELYDPRTGTFTRTGTMTTDRGWSYARLFTATLLTDGRVLIAGGQNIASAEVYDPRTGKFHLTGSMTAARQGHAAALLPNGRVLIAGGFGASFHLSSAELYDPGTATFTATGSMAVNRFVADATVLHDGRVLVTGGQGVVFASAELYDPATGRFIVTGSMATAREHNSVTLLSDGRVLIAGGRIGTPSTFCDSPSGPGDVASAEVYQP